MTYVMIRSDGHGSYPIYRCHVCEGRMSLKHVEKDHTDEFERYIDWKYNHRLQDEICFECFKAWGGVNDILPK